MKLIMLCLLITGLIACRNLSGSSTAKNIIPKDTMVMLFTDMHLADADAQSKNQRLDTAQAVLRKNYQAVFSHYQINTTRFKQSLKFYTEHPKELDEMYAQVISNLSKLNN